ncbi:hypothetical protein BJY27_000218 [Streptomyces rapamycinicus]|uniref:Uncharacterized protein n=2 Tax=Streptomyces rapamycinicus TaxID=1226757 RepID=A0A3L8R932_STRRN|nr:hypothetical protein [Streptomyces rapamycinicus]RLV76080.1 hypothetical protein D3C57_142680 [Streptomyces rapamycinicus NRRL 5491]
MVSAGGEEGRDGYVVETGHAQVAWNAPWSHAR